MSSLTHLPAHRLPVRESFRDKHLVVTGVIGFLGKVWLAMVLDHLPEVRRVTVFARGKAREDAHARFERIYRSSPAFRPLREKLGTDLHHLIADKVRVVDSTLSAPLGGLDEAFARELMRDVDAVVHFAGLTDFEPDPALAVDANIHGAARIGQGSAGDPT